MTEEEKLAEEYADKSKPNFVVNEYGSTVFTQLDIERAYLAGAEFGYNKANEWHYVKDELPPENVPLNIITFDKNKKKRLWEGEYKGGNGQ